MDDETTPGIERRSFLKRAAVVSGATVWATPTVQSLVAPAFATGTGLCPPERTVRFKYDVAEDGTGRFDSGDAGGGGASWCLPDGYADAAIQVNGAGSTATFTLGGVTYSITVTISNGGKTATVLLPSGAVVEDLQAKAGNERNGECDDLDGVTGSTATVTLEDRGISFVAGVICIPA